MASSGSFSTWNNLRYSSTSGITYSQGNCKVETTSGYPTVMNNFAPKTGKWYVEFYNHENNGYNVLGIVQQESIDNGDYGNWLPNGVTGKQMLYYSHNGNKATQSSSVSYGSTWGSGNQIIGCALDMDNGKVWWSLNGTFQASGDPAAGTNAAFDNLDTSDGFYMAFSDYNSGADGIMGINCGQDSTFGGATTAGGNTDDNGFGDFKYAPPTGFLAMCTANLPTATALDPGETNDDYPGKQFNCIQYTGNRVDNSSTNALTGIGFKPDLVWIKCISGTSASSDYRLTDSTRTATTILRANQDTAEQTESNGVESFDSDGFTVGGDNNYNNASSNYIAWCWKASAGQAQDKTYAVKVVSDGGNKYRFDDHGTSAITIEVNEGSTITFDQSDSSNSGHPLRLSTTSNGTHGGGTEYTTGVTTTGVPGNAGAKTVITVAASAPTLYYYCTQHSGMGGQMNTPALSEGIGNSHTAGSSITKVQKSTTGGFSIMTYSGTGSNATIEHGLDSVPEFIIVKRRSSTQNWAIYHVGMGNTGNLILNGNNSKATGSAWWQDTTPTTSVISIGTEGRVNASGQTYVAYAWHGVEGYSKFGRFVGNGNENGPFIYTGFRPRLIFIKGISATNNWLVHDTVRETFNPIDTNLHWDTTDGNATEDYRDFDILSNGFKIKSDNGSLNHPAGDEYIYGAWGDVPFKYNNAF